MQVKSTLSLISALCLLGLSGALAEDIEVTSLTADVYVFEDGRVMILGSSDLPLDFPDNSFWDSETGALAVDTYGLTLLAGTTWTLTLTVNSTFDEASIVIHLPKSDIIDLSSGADATYSTSGGETAVTVQGADVNPTTVVQFTLVDEGLLSGTRGIVILTGAGIALLAGAMLYMRG